MRTLITLIVTSFGVLISLMGSAQESEHPELLKVPFVTGEYRPYSSETMPDFGATTDLISSICNAAGIQPLFIFLPWKRVELNLLQGTAFGAFPYSENPDRKTRFDFSDDLYRVSYSLIYHDGNPKIHGLSGNENLPDLKDFRFGIIAGSFAEPRLKELGIKYDAATTVDQLVGMLRLNRFDFYIDDQAIVFDAASRLFPAEATSFHALQNPFAERTANVMVSRAYPNTAEILKRFNIGLAKIKQTGEYDRILAKHHMLTGK
ncbi:MAG TPA: transporter substrate-binding domain-containing protein [Pseudomonas sp.]|nr:transporter substrate-binding domain-containing protein [Pseudomonas sp.]